jgi:uncharacterized protein YndB with AHSA1/START domain
MGTIDYSVWIEASPEDVWSVYVDPMRIPEWQSGSPLIERVDRSGDQVGSAYVSRRKASRGSDPQPSGGPERTRPVKLLIESSY